MSYGYSLRLVERNRQASDKKLGVRLGRVCIAQEVPVTVVANEFGVTRQTVYNWFTGLSIPGPSVHTRVINYIAKLS
jgi:hypothetical protein